MLITWSKIKSILTNMSPLTNAAKVVTETNDEGKEEVVYKIDIGANR